MNKIIVGLALVLSFSTWGGYIDDLNKKCDDGDGGSCFNVGLMYANGENVKQDYPKAVEYFKKACESDYAIGCAGIRPKNNYCQNIKVKNRRVMTTILVEGVRGSLSIPAKIDTGADTSVIPENVAQGVGYLNYQYRKFGVVAGTKELKVVRVKKISMPSMAFENVRVVVEPGYNKSLDEEMALIGMSELSQTNFYYKDGVFTICSKKGADLAGDVSDDDFKSFELFSKACSLSDGDGCNNLGEMYDNGIGVKRSKQKALRYFGKACNLKSKLGCKNFAKLNKELTQQ